MQVLQAWEVTKGDPCTLIGIVESSVDVNHPDFKNNIQEVYKLGGMFHPMDVRSITHGTQVTGLIAAKDNNRVGIAGLAPKCKVVMALYGKPKTKILDQKECDLLMCEKINHAIRYLVDKGCEVINCSFKIGPNVKSSFEYAIDNDVVVVLASGNENNEESFEYLPDEVLIVGGVDKKEKRWKETFSINFHKANGANYGKFLDVVAPIEGLVLCYPTNNKLKGKKEIQKALFRITNAKGTSLAAPMATSLVALIRSLRPDLDAKTVVEIVKQGADDLGSVGWDKYTGHGKLNFNKSLTLAKEKKLDD
jgi:subtilisin family serine protease